MKQGMCLLLTVGEAPSCPVMGWQAFSLELSEMCFDVLFCGMQPPSSLSAPCYWREVLASMARCLLLPSLFISFLGSTWVLNLGLPSIEPLVFALRRALTKLPRQALNLLCIVQEDLKHGSPLLLASQVIKIIGYATRLGLCPSTYLHCFPLILWTKASRNQILFKCFFPHHSHPIVPRSWSFCG